MTPEYTIYALWGAWAVSWTVAALWSDRTEKRAGMGAEVFFRVLIYVGLIPLFGFRPRHHYYAQAQLWYFGDALNWILVALTAAGFLFTWWARIHLGRLWSSLVTKKAGHRVVDTGPYSLVRHPIYSGIILAAFATAIEKGTSFALLGAGIVTLAFYAKALREERFLRAELGEGAYDAYARETAMLVPFVRTQNEHRTVDQHDPVWDSLRVLDRSLEAAGGHEEPLGRTMSRQRVRELLLIKRIAPGCPADRWMNPVSPNIMILPRKGVLGAWDRPVGLGMTRGETALVLGSSSIGAAVSGA